MPNPAQSASESSPKQASASSSTPQQAHRQEMFLMMDDMMNSAAMEMRSIKRRPIFIGSGEDVTLELLNDC